MFQLIKLIIILASRQRREKANLLLNFEKEIIRIRMIDSERVRTEKNCGGDVFWLFHSVQK